MGAGWLQYRPPGSPAKLQQPHHQQPGGSSVLPACGYHYQPGPYGP